MLCFLRNIFLFGQFQSAEQANQVVLTEKQENSAKQAAETVAQSVLSEAILNISGASSSTSSALPISHTPNAPPPSYVKSSSASSFQSLSSRDNDNELLPPLFEVVDNIVQEDAENDTEMVSVDSGNISSTGKSHPPSLPPIDKYIEYLVWT